MIRPVSNYSVYKTAKSFKSDEPQAQEIYYRKERKTPISYTHSLGISGLYGLGMMGISSIFLRGWRNPIAIGTLVAGVMMLLNIPDKMNPYK